MLAGKTPAQRSRLVRQAARLIVEEALEGEAAEGLGRGYYERSEASRGYRNGYRLGGVKSAESEIEFAVPQVADTTEPFCSRIREVIRGRTEELNSRARSLSERRNDLLHAALADTSPRNGRWRMVKFDYDPQSAASIDTS